MAANGVAVIQELWEGSKVCLRKPSRDQKQLHSCPLSDNILVSGAFKTTLYQTLRVFYRHSPPLYIFIIISINLKLSRKVLSLQVHWILPISISTLYTTARIHMHDFSKMKSVVQILNLLTQRCHNCYTKVS